MAESFDHAALQANYNSVTFASEGKKQEWLDLYADDAVVMDPVGVSPFDATGEGHKGKAAIESFWDNVIAPAGITVEVHSRIPSGDRACAVHQTATSKIGTKVDMIATYQLNDEGKIASMCAYWNYSEMEAQLKKMGFA